MPPTPMDFDIKALRLFATTCDLRSMRLAAEQEHIEPSAVSKRIAQLEQLLGTSLLVRGRRGVQPTQAGLVILDHARTVLFTVDRMRSDIAAFGSGIRALVRMVASPSAVAESLPDDLAAFMREEEHKQIRIDLEERTSREVVRLVSEGVAELGVCWDSVDMQGLEQRPYREDELVLAAPIGHPLARLAKVRFVQTHEYEHVSLPPATAVHAMLARAAARAGASVQYRAIVSNFDAALRVVGAGLGLAVIPRAVIERANTPGVIAVALEEPWARRRFAICVRPDAVNIPAVARILAWLDERAADCARATDQTEKKRRRSSAAKGAGGVDVAKHPTT